MANKYETGIKDQYNNREFDFTKVFDDLKQVIKGKKKFNKDLYEVMMLRFTIAHYNMYGWLDTYNGNWKSLADQIYPRSYGGFDCPDSKIFDDIKQFLTEHDTDKVSM